MSNSFNFSSFSRQSSKGVLVIYMDLIFKCIKFTWFLLFLILKDFSKVSAHIGVNYMYLGLVFILLFLLVRSYLIYKNFQFKIEDEHFILKQGILKRTNTDIPFHRIQNINFKQNIVQQIISVFEVSIETAGSSKTEIGIQALSFAKATALKELISKSSKFEKELATDTETKPFVKIRFYELFKVSLTENHLQNLFLFLAIVIGFFQKINQVIYGFG
jgi:putative membrane protein